jgi:Gpi18-like mannosyltransferase
MVAFQKRLLSVNTWLRRIWERLNDPQLRWLVIPIAAFLITRLIVFGGAYLADVALPAPVGANFWHAAPDNAFLDAWARWDSGFYLTIAKSGYAFVPGQQSSVAFFPLYPMLVNLLTVVVRNDVLAGVLVSNLCFLGALIFFYRLVILEFDEPQIAMRAVFYIAAFPTAFFFTAIYTESTFLLFAVGTFYFARRKMWAWASFMGTLCTVSRIVGVMMFGIIGLEWLRAQGWTFGRIRRREAWQGLWTGLRTNGLSLLPVMLVPIGMLSYMVFLQSRFHDPIAFWTTQAAWERQSIGPLGVVVQSLASLHGSNFLTGTNVWWNVPLDLGALFALLLCLIPIWRRLGESYAIYSLLSVLIPLSSSTQSLVRYVLVVFPFFMMLAVWGRHPLIDRTLTVLFSLLLGIFTALFVNWRFVA